MTFEKPSLEELRQMCSETPKYRHLTARYCLLADGTPGCGVDIASQGCAVAPWAMGFDLPKDEFDHYCSNQPAKGPVQLRGHAEHLPFDDNSLDFVYSSHLLEDFLEWEPILTEWVRALKPGGHLIILVPDKELWAAALDRGQPPNCAHKHESRAGELTEYAAKLNLEVIEDRLTQEFEGDYTVLFVAKKR